MRDSVWYRWVGDPVRANQVFLVCRHAGVLLGAVVLARALPQDMVGQVEKLMFLGYLLTFFWTEALLKGYLALGPRAGSRDFQSSFLWLVMLASLVMMGILVLSGPVLVPWLTGARQLPGLGLFALYQAMIVPLWLAPFIGLLRGLNPYLLAAYVLFGPAFSAWIGLGQIEGVEGVLIGWLSYALVGLAWLVIQAGRPQVGLLKVWRTVWPLAWPLVLFAVSAGIARSVDAWMIGAWADERAFAVFRYGAREFPWVTALTAAFSTSMIPVLASGMSTEPLRDRSIRLMHVVMPGVALAMLASPVLFPWVFGPGYAGSAGIFNIYLLLALTQVVFPQTVLTARGETRILWYVSLVELALNILVSLPLFFWLGLPGVAWGTLIAFVAEKGLLLEILRRRFRMPVRSIVPVRQWILYALLLVLCFLLSVWIG